MTETKEVQASAVEQEGQSIYDLFENDSTMEQQGVVVDFGIYGKFKIARAGGSNTAFSKSFKKRFGPVRTQHENGTLPEEKGQKILAAVYADSIIQEWEGVLGRDKKPIPFNHANVTKLLLELPDLFLSIRNHSTKAENYRRNEIEDVSGN